MIKEFPQINRIITASIFYFLIILVNCLVAGVFTLIILANFYTQLFPENEEYTKLKIQALSNPDNFSALTDLGAYLNKYGLVKESLHYYQIAQTVYNRQNLNQPQILGVHTPFNLYQENVIRRQQLQAKLDYWKKITEIKPLYRDGFIQLGILYYQLGEYKNAKAAINQAWVIDPFYQDKEKFSLISNL